MRAEVIAEFQQMYYDSGVWVDTYWMGARVGKCPLDLWQYQEIIARVRPDVIIETGTAYGGSALFFASLCELIGNGRVVTIDHLGAEHYKDGRPDHERVTYLLGASESAATVAAVKSLIGVGEKVMVSLDSDHHKEHVLAEMRLYGALVTPGSYMIVEDTIVGHPILPEFGPGPMEAVEEFLRESSDFVRDRRRERFLMTFNAGGWLRKVRRCGLR